MWLAVITCVVVSGTASASWWDNAVYYRVLVDSFKDLNGDGLGDLQGVTKQLSYVRAMGADAVILSPIQDRSPDCARPGSRDLSQIDQRYGNDDAFKMLMEKSKKLELKVVMTIDVQRISAASDWFNHSASRTPSYEDWIVWRDGTNDASPMLENSVDSWVWDNTRNAYWASNRNESLLNLCSEGLIESLRGIMCSWLQRGVAGFIINPDFKLDIDCGVKLVKKISASAANCARTSNLDAPITIVDTDLAVDLAAKYFGDRNTVISNTLTSSKRRTTPDLAVALHAALLYCPQDMTPTWLTSSFQENRVATRYGSEMVDAINLISLILPGSVIIQQGDELGAADAILEWVTSSKCWPNQPYASAAPFPWDDSPNAGFTNVEPWLPLAPNYRYANAKTEFANEYSHFGVVRVASAMRKSPAFGPHVEIKRFADALAILRWGASGSLLLISNLGQNNCELQPSKLPGLAAEMTIAVSSGGSSFSPGTHVHTEKVLKLIPGESVLLAGPPRHCGGPGPVDKIASKLSEGWQKLNKYFGNN